MHNCVSDIITHMIKHTVTYNTTLFNISRYLSLMLTSQTSLQSPDNTHRTISQWINVLWDSKNISFSVLHFVFIHHLYYPYIHPFPFTPYFPSFPFIFLYCLRASILSVFTLYFAYASYYLLPRLPRYPIFPIQSIFPITLFPRFLKLANFPIFPTHRMHPIYYLPHVPHVIFIDCLQQQD